MPRLELNITKALLEELNLASEKVLKGYNLGGSDLINSIDWEYRSDQFVLLANDYFTYVSTGRRARARKVPVLELIKWLKKKNIQPGNRQSHNSLAFALQNSIYKTGIKGKNFIDPVINVTLEILSEYIAEDLSEMTAEEIARQMTFTLGLD